MKRKHFLNLLLSLNPEKNKPFNMKKAVLVEMLNKSISGETLTYNDYVKLVNCIHVSALTGKLEEFYSISSCVAENDICKARAKDCNSICHQCYAMQSVEYRSNLRLTLLINHIVLNCFDIPANAWSLLAVPTINGKARIESHGDVASIQAALNMNRIIESHEHIVFGIWTKNYNFWRIAFDRDGKHKNCTFLVSSDRLNKQLEIPANIAKYVDHVFTVYDLKTVKQENINIQCGFHRCKECGICYDTNNTTFYVNEILKKDTKRYMKYMGIE